MLELSCRLGATAHVAMVSSYSSIANLGESAGPAGTF